MTKTPECPVAVVIAAFNRANLLSRTITSIRQQTVLPAEIIVVDDGSSDDTGAVAARAGARVLRHESNLGPGAARNTGVGATSQPWVAVLDSDDQWLPHHLGTLWPLREGHDLLAAPAISAGWTDPDRRLVGWPGRHPLRLKSPAQLLYPENPIPSTALLRRSAIDRVGGYDEELRFGEDLDLYARILEDGGGVVAPVVTSVYHRHAAQTTADRASTLAQRERLVVKLSQRPWAGKKVLERAEAVTAWDEMRLALKRREWSRAAGRGGWMATHGRAPGALLGLWSWRYRARQAGRQLATE
jgi:glycosyltransferase involved in cell wall biosynthesis